MSWDEEYVREFEVLLQGKKLEVVFSVVEVDDDTIGDEYEEFILVDEGDETTADLLAEEAEDLQQLSSSSSLQESWQDSLQELVLSDELVVVLVPEKEYGV